MRYEEFGVLVGYVYSAAATSIQVTRSPGWLLVPY